MQKRYNAYRNRERLCGALSVSWLAAPPFALGLLLASSPEVLAQSAQTIELAPVEVIATTPGEGATISANKVPAMTTSVGSSDFARINSPNVTKALQQYVPGAVTIDTNGNDFSQEFYYRGFVASPVQGRPQGLAVYQDGVRLNEPFGDTVNWDLIPPQAIYNAEVFTNNPIFGLNALGGAINLQMKNGFLWQGFEAQTMGGSYGRIEGSFQYGMKKDNWGLYVSADALHDNGWREFSPSSLIRLYGDLGYRTPYSETHLAVSGASNFLSGILATPIQMLDQNWNSVWTNPQYSLNQMGSVALNTKVNPTSTWTVQNNLYYRHFYQRHLDGNDSNLNDCGLLAGGAASGALCDSENNSPIVNPQGTPIPSVGAASATFPYGTINQTWVHTNTVGDMVQATNRDKIFNHDNQITFGTSLDQSWIHYNANTLLGMIDPALTVITGGVPGGGSIIQDQNNQDYVQTFLGGTTTYVGVFALDTFNVTKQLAVTAGARWNDAIISTQDLSGMDPELNATNTYQRINPVVGITYEFTPNLTGYAGYSEANRAPTPLETDCSNPVRPCILASSLQSDPPLAQVVSHTVEAGFRGHFDTPNKGLVTWKAGYFRTQNSNDIIQLSSVILGTGYYTNVPETLRQGVEAGVNLHMGQLTAYANYSHIDATYQFTGVLSSPFNPYADANGNILVTPGDHIPGIPRDMGKFGLEYAFTPKFKAGLDVLIVGSQYYIGDDSNQNPQLPAYWVANIHGSYQVTDHIQVFGLVNNLFDNHYGTFGNFFDLGSSAQYALAKPLTNPAMITPAQPLSIYGGVKVDF